MLEQAMNSFPRGSSLPVVAEALTCSWRRQPGEKGEAGRRCPGAPLAEAFSFIAAQGISGSERLLLWKAGFRPALVHSSQACLWQGTLALATYLRAHFPGCLAFQARRSVFGEEAQRVATGTRGERGRQERVQALPQAPVGHTPLSGPLSHAAPEHWADAQARGATGLPLFAVRKARLSRALGAPKPHRCPP